MLKIDKDYFYDFISDDSHKRKAAVEYFDALENGHFEDHPTSKKLVKENIKNLESIVLNSEQPLETEWAIQFCADAEYISPAMKPAIYNLLNNGECTFIPTILWCISQNPEHFTDCGTSFITLANHQDREVRWRIPYVILQMPQITDDMIKVISLLSNDTDQTTQLYIKHCHQSQKWPNKALKTDD